MIDFLGDACVNYGVHDPDQSLGGYLASGMVLVDHLGDPLGEWILNGMVRPCHVFPEVIRTKPLRRHSPTDSTSYSGSTVLVQALCYFISHIHEREQTKPLGDLWVYTMYL